MQKCARFFISVLRILRIIFLKTFLESARFQEFFQYRFNINMSKNVRTTHKRLLHDGSSMKNHQRNYILAGCMWNGEPIHVLWITCE
ncbi:hypothetical protein C4568_01930 [Candidatus Parcubacteria bacterium]|nr:MAG: hypothetical protein C4568_01930 [Candidatus Parcubacteria bacterium]